MRNFTKYTIVFLLLISAVLAVSCSKSDPGMPTKKRGGGPSTEATETTAPVTEAPVVTTFITTSHPLVVDPEIKKVICLDPGHGIGDPGVIIKDEEGNEIYEKTLNYAVALKVKAELERRGFAVEMPRGADDEIPKAGFSSPNICGITNRVEWANNENFMLYLSLHCNSFDDPTVNGTRIYYNTKHNGTQNGLFCNFLLQEISKTAEKMTTITSDAKLHVATGTKMPAALIEMGFITNEDDYQKIISEEWQEDFAYHIADAITLFFDSYYQ